jgi:hypothetical protein
VSWVLPVKGDVIEALWTDSGLWTEDDKDDEWFTVDVLLPDAH